MAGRAVSGGTVSGDTGHELRTWLGAANRRRGQQDRDRQGAAPVHDGHPKPAPASNPHKACALPAIGRKCDGFAQMTLTRLAAAEGVMLAVPGSMGVRRTT